MKKIDEHRYIAEENKTFVNKISGLRIGHQMYLGDSDDINNYIEEDMTDVEKENLKQVKTNKEEKKMSKRH